MKKIVQFILQYRIIHIIFWVYMFINLYHLKQQVNPNHFVRHYYDTATQILSEMLVVYFTIYYLIPKLIRKEKYLQFAVFSFLVLIAGGFAEATFEFFTRTFFLNSPHYEGFIMTLILFFFDMLPIQMAFIGIVLSYDYYKKNEKNKMIEKERLESELNFLKSQINPHFLFNALNSIYVLMKEDIHLSEQILLKFSSLLRYQLYDCNNNETTLESEIEFLKNYMDLEKIRNGENRIVNFSIPENVMYLRIAPFILIPFVENAFKHISHFRDQVNMLDIQIRFTNHTLFFKAENTCEENEKKENTSPNGIGLQNVKRRLELLYPEKHTLQITKKQNIHTVNLTIQLNGN